MARAPVIPQRQLTLIEIDKGIARFRRRIELLENFDPQSVARRDDPSIETLEKSIEQALADTFGVQTPDYIRYRKASALDTASINMMHRTPIAEVREGLVYGKSRAIAILGQAIEALQERRADLPENSRSRFGPQARPDSTDRRVFLVHGHDQGAKEAVARFLEKIGFNAVVLHEQPNRGKTIIEKFEENADVSFAVVLLTPDDAMADGEKRARQNVIIELGYFIGKLGRDRVCALKKGETELPSDILGVIWTALDDAGAWKTDLARELRAAGFEIDWNKVMA